MIQPLESAEKTGSRRRYDGTPSEDPYHVNFLPSGSAPEQPASTLLDLIVTAFVIVTASDCAVARAFSHRRPSTATAM
jgi:hypothetical protein